MLLCPMCGEKLSSELLIASARVAICARCGRSTSVPDLRELEPGFCRTPDRLLPLPCPTQIHVVRTTDGVLISYAWRRVSELTVPMLYCAIFAIMVAFAVAVSAQKGAHAPLPSIFAMLGLIGAALAYWFFAVLVNRTTIKVGAGRLRIRHGPLPWWGGRDLTVGEIAEFDHALLPHYGAKSRRVWRYDYNVGATLTAGRRRVLVRALRELEFAKCIELELTWARKRAQQIADATHDR